MDRAIVYYLAFFVLAVLAFFEPPLYAFHLLHIMSRNEV
jgi:hypothetical protein